MSTISEHQRPAQPSPIDVELEGHPMVFNRLTLSASLYSASCTAPGTGSSTAYTMIVRNVQCEELGEGDFSW